MVSTTQPQDELPDFLTVQEVASLLRISRNAVYQLANRYLDTDGAEGIPAKRLGNRLIRIPRARLEEWHGGPIMGIPRGRPTPDTHNDHARGPST